MSHAEKKGTGPAADRQERLKVSISLCETAITLFGVNTRDYYFNADTMADVEARFWERFRPDGASISITLRGMAEAMGSVISYKNHCIPSVETPRVREPKDVYGLRVPDPLKDGRLPIVLDALVKLRKRLDGKIAVGAGMAGPVSVAIAVCGAENFLRWTRRHPEEIKHMMDIIVEGNNRYIDELGKRGIVGLSFSDPVASTDLLGYKQFLEFSLPYFTANVRYGGKVLGKNPGTHICGHTKGIWKDIVGSGVSSFSIDNVEDLAEAKEIMGDSIAIIGNVPPVNVLNLGGEEDIRRSVAECILKGHDSPKGYALGSGCQVPLFTPAENIDAYIRWGKELGKLPIDVERLQRIAAGEEGAA